MCGIVGIVKFNNESVQLDELKRLNDSIVHRGPDDEGYFTEGPVGLGMRRLSIIDISGGHQPIFSKDQNTLIVFNGEVYNHRQLKQELQGLGVNFKTSSDTEVVLEGYLYWGVDVFARMNGMWGLAIYDRLKGELIISTDRVGEKQIYYSINDNYLVFGSEMKIPMLYDSNNRVLNLSTLSEFLIYGYIGGPDTALNNVKLLTGSHWAKIDLSGKMEIKKFWNINSLVNNPPKRISEMEAAEQAYSLLTDSVRLRLVSDVPISVMLSSGLDSSALAYILAKELQTPLKTFSLGYTDRDFDESTDAGDFAKRMGLPWERITIDSGDVVDCFPKFIRHIDSLQSNTAQLVYYFTNSAIRKAGYKVTLNGNGGDELFAGYPTYRADSLFNYYRHLPYPLKKLANMSANLIPPTFGRVSIDYALKKFTENTDPSPQRAHSYWRTMFSQSELDQLLCSEVKNAMHSFTRIYDESFEEIGLNATNINAYLCADMKSWLMPMLPWTDNMTMAHSIEMRLPLLDHRLIEWCFQLSPDLLFSGWTLKKLMKKFLAGRIPDDVLYRKKRGTHLPVSRWLNKELRPILDHYLSNDVLNSENIFNMKYVNQLVDEHRMCKRDNTFKLWNLIIFSAWKEVNGITT
jgi:asparagine synthase (glutamine-hydrolysing)